ncbi:MAG: hypothetical protein J5871_00725 [Bacteroidales bacterium]|nr:hypothetical protein [Bacteroidales bacterium]
MKRTILLLLVLFLPLYATFGQGTKKINAIKRNTRDYVYAEATMDTPEAAYKAAKELLLVQAREYAKEHAPKYQKEYLSIKKISDICESVQMPRGNMYKVFVYAKKTDIVPTDGGGLAAEGPVPGPVLDSGQAPGAGQALEPWQQKVIDELLAVDTFSAAWESLARMKAVGRVKKYGPHAACSDVNAAFWLIGDADGKVLTVLGPDMAAGNGRTDFRKGIANADLSAYSGAPAVWFTLSKR